MSNENTNNITLDVPTQMCVAKSKLRGAILPFLDFTARIMLKTAPIIIRNIAASTKSKNTPIIIAKAVFGSLIVSAFSANSVMLTVFIMKKTNDTKTRMPLKMSIIEKTISGTDFSRTRIVGISVVVPKTMQRAANPSQIATTTAITHTITAASPRKESRNIRKPITAIINKLVLEKSRERENHNQGRYKNYNT